MKRFVDAAHNVFQVRENFATCYGLYRAPIGQEPNQTEEQRARERRLFSAEVRFLTFSDTVVAYVNLREDPTRMQGVFAILSTCTAVFKTMLAVGIPTRGAVDVGLADKLSDLRPQGIIGSGDDAVDVGYAHDVSEDEIYGPVLASVHRLESRIAQWPRVVVGDGLIRYLQLLVEPVDGIQRDAGILKAAGLCHGFIAKDVDGWPVLDYLGQQQRDHVAERRATNEPAYGERSAYRFVRNQARRYRDERNEKLAVRYNLTLQYFRSRAHLWPGMLDEGT